MLKIKVLPHGNFDEKMVELGLNDGNVDNTNMAFISIIGTEECLKYWVESDDKHYFNNEHENVLNLEFDDISFDVMYNGHHFKTMTMGQAEKTIDFIERMLEKGVDTIFLHCRASISRSRGVAEFICRYCKAQDIEVEYLDRNDYVNTLNFGVLNRLQHAYLKKHKLAPYANDEDYPNELIDTIRIINRNENG